MQLIKLPLLAEFTDRHGNVRPIAGCSVIGRFEFVDRLAQMRDRLTHVSQEVSLEETYDIDPDFRHYCNQCFELNGIDLDWISLPMLEPMLLCSGIDADGKAYPGWLVLLNQAKPKPGSKPKPGGASATLAEAIAGLAIVTGSESEAIHLANLHNGKLVIEIAEAKIDAQMAKPSPSQPRQQKIPTAEEANQVLAQHAETFAKMRQM